MNKKSETGYDRRAAFAKRDFIVVLKERGGWQDFYRVIQLPKAQQPCQGCGR